jgi:chorismate dehydratase
VPLRVSTISFLNPAPLLYNFEHEPSATRLRAHYDVHYTLPSHCAVELDSGVADLGLIPIAALTPELAIVPGCTIASLDEVRSILLLVKNPQDLPASEVLGKVQSVAADSASRSSVAYVRILLEHFHRNKAIFIDRIANPIAMLASADAALLIGDPALLARERQEEVNKAVDSPLLWLDVARLWREQTALPWVAAVWAVRLEALGNAALTARQLTDDLTASRDAGLANIDQLVIDWSPRVALSESTIRTYLTHNIHYKLDADCLRAIEVFRSLASGIGILPPLPKLNLLVP